MHSAKKHIKIAFVNDSKNPDINDSDLLLARELEKLCKRIEPYLFFEFNQLASITFSKHLSKLVK